MSDNLILFLIILLADFCATAIQSLIKRVWKKKIELLKCELCEKPRKLTKTKDDKHLACRTCKKLYNDSVVKDQREAG